MGYQYLADDQGNPRQDGIQRTGDAGTTMPTWVPADANSADWRAFQAWLAAGNTPAAAVWSPPPRTATAKQVRYALNDLGVRTAWNTAVAAGSQSAQDYWTSADPMYEDNAKIAKWCAAAGITPRALFDQAVTE